MGNILYDLLQYLIQPLFFVLDLLNVDVSQVWLLNYTLKDMINMFSTFVIWGIMMYLVYLVFHFLFNFVGGFFR